MRGQKDDGTCLLIPPKDVTNEILRYHNERKKTEQDVERVICDQSRLRHRPRGAGTCTNAMFDCVRQLCGGKLPFRGDAPTADITVFRKFDAPDMWRALSISEFTLTTRFEWRVIGITPRMCSGSGRLENFWDTFECCILR